MRMWMNKTTHLTHPNLRKAKDCFQKEDLKMQKYRPGEQVPSSGNYVAYDRNGSNGGTLHLEEGQRFPATQHEGSYYVSSNESDYE